MVEVPCREQPSLLGEVFGTVVPQNGMKGVGGKTPDRPVRRARNMCLKPVCDGREALRSSKRCRNLSPKLTPDPRDPRQRKCKVDRA